MPDTTPPVTSVAPAISVAATDTTVSVTQTISENGTGYYLMLPAASAAPTVNTVVTTGSSFSMTGGVASSVNITGLAASTAYKYYFVAKDTAGNTQATVSTGLDITTAAAEVPPIMGNVPDQTYTSGSAITNLNISNYVILTNGDAITAYTLTGALPTGLSFNSTTGVLSGTPTQTGTFNLSVTATDNDGASNSDSFTITVSAAPDTTPDQFTFSDQTGVALSTVIESAPIVVSGINTAASISVAGGEYAISTDGGSSWSAYTSTAGTVNNGNWVKVRHTSSASNSTAINTTLTIG